MTPATVTFKYPPFAYVLIIFNELQYRGRIARCIYDGVQPMYKVQYSDDKGDIRFDEFYEDELAPRAAP